MNELPTVEIPVPYDENWHSDAWNQAEVRVWRDGDRLPIEELDHRRVETRRNTKRTVLECVGGVQLRNRVEREVEFEDAHAVAEDVADEASDYILNVDPPSNNVIESEMADAAESASWTALLEDAPFDDDVPLSADGDTLVEHPTAVYAFGVNYDASSIPLDTESNDRYVISNATVIAGINNWVEWDLSFDHDVPVDHGRVLLRMYHKSEDHPGFEVTVNGDVMYSVPADTDLLSTPDDPQWITSLDIDHVSEWEAGDDLTITLTIDETSEGSDPSDLYIDAVTVTDDRYTINTIQDSLTDGEPLSWPNEYPDSIDAETQDYTTPFQVVGGRFDADVTNTEENQSLAVSQDQGATWEDEPNTESIDHDWEDGAPQVRGRIRLSYYDAGGGVGELTRLRGRQSVESATLYADIDDTPTLANRGLDGRAVDLLQRIAEDRNFVFEIRAIDDNTLSLEWAQPGQRTSDTDPEVVEFDIDRQTEDLVEQMTIFGSPNWRRGEAVSVPTSDWQALQNEDLVELSESVTDPDDGSQYTRGEDYEMHYLNGEIQALATGAIDDGETVEIDYQYRLQGTYPDDSEVSDPREDVATITGLGSSLICEQAAFYIVDRANTPIWEGTMTIARDEADFSVIDEINPPDIPTQDTPLQVRSIETSDESISVRLASRRTVGEIVQNLSQRMGQLEERA